MPLLENKPMQNRTRMETLINIAFKVRRFTASTPLQVQRQNSAIWQQCSGQIKNSTAFKPRRTSAMLNLADLSGR